VSARLRALVLLPALAACYAYAPPRATARSPRASPPDEGQEVEGARARIVDVARGYAGQRFAGDCSAFVRQVLREADVELGPLPSATSMSESLHLATRTVARPRPGDLVFFHDTYDRNRDGRLGDPWTHVALVEEVDGDQIWILHRGGRGIVRIKMDLAHPSDATTNDPIRVRTRSDPPGTRYLTGELFSGYGAPF
jgi:hypothetical protein